MNESYGGSEKFEHLCGMSIFCRKGQRFGHILKEIYVLYTVVICPNRVENMWSSFALSFVM